MVIFNYTEEFLRQAKRLTKRYRSFPDDIDRLQRELQENPNAGVDMGNGIHKIRVAVASKGKGKRGGLRAITLNVITEQNNTTINLLTIYDKKDYPNVSESYIDDIIRTLK